jgi:acetyl-CoA carboxylase biotin carboxylase subunit
LDTHVTAGFVVTPYYDPMIAKLIVKGVDRKEAVNLLAAALDEFQVQGIETNIPFLRRLVRHPDYKRGKVSTAFVPRFLEEDAVAP